MPEVDAAKDSAEFEAAAEAAAEAALDDPAAAAAAPPAAVDPLASDLVHTCVVYRSPSSGAEYSVTMTCTEVNAGPYGKHSQYVMQLLWNPVQRLAILWTRWGRVGEIVAPLAHDHHVAVGVSADALKSGQLRGRVQRNGVQRRRAAAVGRDERRGQWGH